MNTRPGRALHLRWRCLALLVMAHQNFHQLWLVCGVEASVLLLLLLLPFKSPNALPVKVLWLLRSCSSLRASCNLATSRSWSCVSKCSARLNRLHSKPYMVTLAMARAWMMAGQ